MKRAYVLNPNDRADVAVETILRHLFNTLEMNVGGVLEDEDIEHLHDLRVANRRTRTALSQIKDVLPSFVHEDFSPKFRWLGSATGPCRDLDVAISELDEYCLHPGFEHDELEPIRGFLAHRRRAEHDYVRASLRSARFRQLVEDWRIFLVSTTRSVADQPSASVPILEVAGPRILKAAKRIRKRGAGISSDAPALLLHRLRIDGKKLRYLLEFFFDLYDPKTVSRLVNELKRFQDILGEFNDTEVQLALIREFHEEHSPTATTGATDRLGELISNRQCDLRAEFSQRFADFASEEGRKLYKKTFRAGRIQSV